jgi:hypothetical protein
MQRFENCHFKNCPEFDGLADALAEADDAGGLGE